MIDDTGKVGVGEIDPRHDAMAERGQCAGDAAEQVVLVSLHALPPWHESRRSLEHPPLASRPSPPQGWRLDAALPQLISPLEGEMAGRPEGGIAESPRAKKG